MRDQDSVAVLQNMRHPSCIAMPCTGCRALNAAIAALQSQQNGAQGGEAADPFPQLRGLVANWAGRGSIMPSADFARELQAQLDAITGDDLRGMIHARQQDNIALAKADAIAPQATPAAVDDAAVERLADHLGKRGGPLQSYNRAAQKDKAREYLTAALAPQSAQGES